MNNHDQNYSQNRNHIEPLQEKDPFRYTVQAQVAGPEYRVTIEHGSIEVW